MLRGYGIRRASPKDYPTIPKCFISAGWASLFIPDGLDRDPPETCQNLRR